VCGCSQGTLRFSIGRIDNHTWRHHLDQRLSLPKRFPNRRRILLGRDWHLLSYIRPAVGTFYQDRVSVGMKCREPKPNCQRMGLKALCVHGRDARPPLEAGDL
jgi:hypothetical protein